MAQITCLYSQSGPSISRTLLKSVLKTTWDVTKDIHIRDHLNKGMLTKSEKSSLCLQGNFCLVLWPSSAIIPESGTLLWYQWLKRRASEWKDEACTWLQFYLFTYLFIIIDWKVFCFVLLFPQEEKVFHLFPLILTLFEHLFFKVWSSSLPIPPKIFCSPVPAPNAKVTSPEVPGDLFQDKPKTKHCALLFICHWLFLSSFHSLDCCLPLLSQLLWRILLSFQMVGDFHQLVVLLLSSAISTAIPVRLLQEFLFHSVVPKVSLILPYFIQIQETLLHLSY